MNSTIHRIPSLFSIVLFLTTFFGHYGYVRADETSDSVIYEMAEIEVTASRAGLGPAVRLPRRCLRLGFRVLGGDRVRHAWGGGHRHHLEGPFERIR